MKSSSGPQPQPPGNGWQRRRPWLLALAVTLTILWLAYLSWVAITAG